VDYLDESPGMSIGLNRYLVAKDKKGHPLLPRRGRRATRQNEHQGMEQDRGAFPAWDTRPRQERPPSWCSWVKATPDPTPLAQQKPLIDATTAKPDEIAAHVRAASE
jgi:hypothetical protein